MTKKPLFVGENVSAEKALSIMSDKKISSLIGFNAAKGQWIEVYLLKKL